MTVNEAIARADNLRLNALDVEQKAEWLRGLEGQLTEMLENVSPAPQKEEEKGWPWKSVWPEEDPVLLLSGPYEEFYVLYLICKIDYYNQEMELYANDRAIYDGALGEAMAWWRRNHMPRKSGNWKV